MRTLAHVTHEAVETVRSPLYGLARKSHFLVWLRRNLDVFEGMVEFAVREGYTFDYRPDFAAAWEDHRWGDIERQLEHLHPGQQRVAHDRAAP